jgi:ribonucleoside-diphosphate reductase alpha chain
LVNETFEEYCHRIASELFPCEEEKYHKLSKILKEQRFIPGGRISVALGNSNKLTPFNCFVSRKIEDNLESIWAALIDAGRILSMGGGVGYDFSKLRPSNDLVSSCNGPAGGPVKFMELFNTQGKIMSSTGGRRSAQMGVLRIDHPDIESFIRAKQDGTSLSAFNLSVGITDKFMEAVISDNPFVLTFGGDIYKTVQARSLWNLIMRSNWDWAEPGVLFLDTINRMNNLSYCETISATNPCGEQVLPPNNCCLLGSFNLTKYLTKMAGGFYFEYASFKSDIPIIVEAYDNLVDLATYPKPEQRKEECSKRRMGLGVTGLANTMSIMGYPYGSEKFLEFTGKILQTLTLTAYDTSITLAEDRGQFSQLDNHIEEYVSSPFIQSNLPPEFIERIRKNGIRNSHLISIAPTGTMSLCCDNVSSGIEPIFAYEFDRVIDDQIYTISDYAYNFYGVLGKTVKDVTIKEHLDVLSTVQKYVDSSVSKTINVSSSTAWEDFKDIYLLAYKSGCKGVTVFRMASKRLGVLSETLDGGNREGILKSCKYNPETGQKECE